MISSRLKRWVRNYSVSLMWSAFFLILLGNSILSYVLFQSVVTKVRRVSDLNQAQLHSQRLLLLMVDAETGHRGYLITGDLAYLEPYLHSQKNYQNEIDQLRAIFSEMPQYLKNVDSIQHYIQQKWTEMQRMQTVLKNAGLEEARRKMLSDYAGKKIMDEIRNLKEQFKLMIQTELTDETARVEASRTQSIVILIVGSLTLAGMTVAAFLLINKQMRFRESMERQLRDVNLDLEKRVQHRTEALLATNENLQQEIEMRTQLEQKTRKAAEELKRSNLELEQFASVASHDLQEPLRKIQAFSDRLVMKYREALDDNAQEYIDRIQTSATRMRALIDDLLTYSRVSSRGKPFSMVDLNVVLLGVLSDLEVRLQETRGTVKYDLLPVIEADEPQMKQLFLNLIGNALKFHRPGVPPEIHIRLAETDNILDEPIDMTLEFKDNGVGFEMQYADRIFQLFQRLHGRNEYDGTGMGLAICKKIVERHHGSIRVQSSPGSGSTFSIVIPYRQPIVPTQEA